MLKKTASANLSEKEQTISWHTLSCETVFARLKSSPAGLSGTEAMRRLAKDGRNDFYSAQRISPWLIFLNQFKNVFVAILLCAVILSAVADYEVEAVLLAGTLLAVTLLNTVREYRLKGAIEELRLMPSPTSTVLRDGSEVEIPARELVSGDVVLLRAGNRVPADVRLTEVVNLQVEEAALTGESVPVEKTVVPLSAGELAIGDRWNMAYAGTVATCGRGRAVVVATGMNTEFGRIAQMIQTIETGKTPGRGKAFVLGIR